MRKLSRTRRTLSDIGRPYPLKAAGGEAFGRAVVTLFSVTVFCLIHGSAQHAGVWDLLTP
jgi:hypothetical protein